MSNIFPGGSGSGFGEIKIGISQAVVAPAPVLATNPCRQESYALMHDSVSGSGEVNQLYLQIQLRVNWPSDSRSGGNVPVSVPGQASVPTSQPE